MKELIDLKNKINILPKNNNIENKEEEETKEKEKQDILSIKTAKLLFYKNLDSNIEVIFENMQILRTKGNNLQIDIEIIIQYDKNREAKYYLDKKKSNFDIIEAFLLNSKDDYIKKLDLAYKEKKHIRYLYGNLFRKIIKYLEGGNI